MSFDQERVRNMKYLFCMTDSTTKQCCCGCSLKVGIIIITIMNLIFTVYSCVFSGTAVLVPTAVTVIGIILIVLQALSSIMLLAGALFENKQLVFYGCIIYEITFVCNLVWDVVFLIILTLFAGVYDYNGQPHAATAVTVVIVMAYIFVVLKQLLEGYFVYVAYSFTKEYGLGTLDQVLPMASPNLPLTHGYVPPPQQTLNN